MFCIPATESQAYCVQRPLCLSAGRHQTRPWVMLSTVWTPHQQLIAWTGKGYSLFTAQSLNQLCCKFLFFHLTTVTEGEHKIWHKYTSLKMKNWFTVQKHAVCKQSLLPRSCHAGRKSTANMKFNFMCQTAYIRWFLSLILGGNWFTEFWGGLFLTV